MESRSRRLEDRIRDLCANATSATDGQLANTLADLQGAISEYTLRIANKTSATLLTWPDCPTERRKDKASGRS